DYYCQTWTTGIQVF
nr:immunoglobulin light chain junction region [Macaca mulatta]MOW27791.1 immunoglobulin light chain junction region [Macaca mulatta]MOW28623.1 immunoglobulin light chain junction region [Macaca mulatta]MOW28710.1 immunoglobulin light chain junction region [Macaca mulatta]MOW29942.1 immunoglobulin light chain junction region [Macaca mulatta]